MNQIIKILNNDSFFTISLMIVKDNNPTYILELLMNDKYTRTIINKQDIEPLIYSVYIKHGQTWLRGVIPDIEDILDNNGYTGYPKDRDDIISKYTKKFFDKEFHPIINICFDILHALDFKDVTIDNEKVIEIMNQDRI